MGDVFPGADAVQVRFAAADQPNDSITEAGIDDFQVERVSCCPSDLDGSGDTDFFDLVSLLADWGPCSTVPPCSADLDGSGDVGFADLVLMLAAWGACE